MAIIVQMGSWALITLAGVKCSRVIVVLVTGIMKLVIISFLAIPITGSRRDGRVNDVLRV